MSGDNACACERWAATNSSHFFLTRSSCTHRRAPSYRVEGHPSEGRVIEGHILEHNTVEDHTGTNLKRKRDDGIPCSQ